MSSLTSVMPYRSKRRCPVIVSHCCMTGRGSADDPHICGIEMKSILLQTLIHWLFTGLNPNEIYMPIYMIGLLYFIIYYMDYNIVA